ncbi:MAG: DNA-directed RNA polymerase sigma-70 factor [Pirellulaceae bacterium]|nr:MAG: DNA-directed RNA polymerase sigma-70 factor [Pirellulaceae bacterium]
MNSTSESLLLRLRLAADSEAWEYFVSLYTPLLFYWARRTGLAREDASDLVQDVLIQLLKSLPEFDYDARRSFRGWLRTITLNCWRQRVRKKRPPTAPLDASLLEELPEPQSSVEFWESDYRPALMRRAIELCRERFQPNTWAALQEYLQQDRPADEIARRHGISVWTLYSAKSRLVRMLRDELDDMLD